VGQFRQIIGQEGDFCGFNGDIRTTQPHRHTHIRRRQRWSIIHAVTHKGDIVPLGLELLDDLHFLRWQDFSVDFTDAQFSSDPLGRHDVVSCHQDSADTQFLEPCDHGTCLGPQGIF